MGKIKLAIYAIHPIMYQAPIFSTLEKIIADRHIDLDSIVLFGDDLSLREVFFEETQVVFKPDTPTLLQGYRHIFLKNYARDSRSGLFSRINLGIFRQLAKQRVDVLLVHGYESLTSWLAVFGAKLMGIKVIWRGEAVRRMTQNRWKYLLKKIVLGFFFKRCDAVMYSCSGNKAYLRDFEVPERRMFPIRCAVDNTFFLGEYQRLRPRRDEIRQSLTIGPEDFVILFCARFTARKRPMDLIQALADLSDRRLVALFVGDGPERRSLEEAAAAKGVRALFVGFKNQSEVGEYYCAADLAAVISAHDPSPKAMNEAMNFALPIIATDVVGTVPDLVRHGENGYVIQVGRIDQLATGLRRLNDNRTLSKSMGRKGQDLVAEWNYNQNVDGILAAVDYVMPGFRA